MRTILVVDDNPEAARELQTQLESTGRFLVVCAHNGPAALNLARSAPPDLVLCNVEMPGMDGGSLACAMQEEPVLQKLPLIFLSSLISPQENATRPTLGRWPIVSKQSAFEIIVRRIDAVLARV